LFSGVVAAGGVTRRLCNRRPSLAYEGYANFNPALAEEKRRQAKRFGIDNNGSLKNNLNRIVRDQIAIMQPYIYMAAANARPAIRKIIAKGGSAHVKVGCESRCLQYFPSFDRPKIRLPWPFSKLQPFRFDITRQAITPGKVVAGVEFPTKAIEGQKVRTEYNQNQVDEAIDAFLDGCQPDDEVSILHDSRL